MTTIELHPEELLDKYLASLLSDTERRTLDHHLAHCSACSLELDLGRQLNKVSQPRVADAELLERAAMHVSKELDCRHSGVMRNARSRVSKRSAAAAAGVLLLAGAAAAAYMVNKLSSVDDSSTDSWVQQGVETQRDARPTTLNRPEDVARQAAQQDDVAPQPIAVEAGRVELDPAAPPTEPGGRKFARALTASELFARANAARRRGDIAQAVRLFGQLQIRFPKSQEQLVSRLALGRILLQQVKSPAPALEQFDAYLAQGGPLEEEAMVGRSLALERLGRRDEERKAWQRLVQKFPDSMHADHAQRRLGDRSSP